MSEDRILDTNDARPLMPPRGICPRCGEVVRRYRETKRCPECSVTRPASAFSHSKVRPDHLDSACKSCVAIKKAPRPKPIENPVENGVAIGYLQEHVATPNSKGFPSGRRILRLKDAVLIERWSGDHTSLPALELAHDEPGMKFRFFPGDRVAIALGGGIGKVLSLRTGEVLWQDEWADMRLDMGDLLALWYPGFVAPPVPENPWDAVKIDCPLGPRHKATIDIDSISCRRDTSGEWLTALDLFQTAHGKSEQDALAEVSRIETARIFALAEQVAA